jgi:hypothetical protein
VSKPKKNDNIPAITRKINGMTPGHPNYWDALNLLYNKVCESNIFHFGRDTYFPLKGMSGDSAEEPEYDENTYAIMGKKMEILSIGEILEYLPPPNNHLDAAPENSAINLETILGTRDYDNVAPFFTSRFFAETALNKLLLSGAEKLLKRSEGVDFLAEAFKRGFSIHLNPGFKNSKSFTPDETFALQKFVQENCPDSVIKTVFIKPLIQQEKDVRAEISARLENYQNKIGIPSNFQDALNMAIYCFSDHLAFHERVKETIAAFPDSLNPAERKVFLQLLNAINGTLYYMRYTSKNLSPREFERLTGFRLELVDHPVKNPHFIAQRTCESHGREVTFFSNVKSEKLPNFAIHFHFMDQEKKILVCHAGATIR